MSPDNIIKAVFTFAFACATLSFVITIILVILG